MGCMPHSFLAPCCPSVATPCFRERTGRTDLTIFLESAGDGVSDMFNTGTRTVSMNGIVSHITQSLPGLVVGFALRPSNTRAGTGVLSRSHRVLVDKAQPRRRRPLSTSEKRR